MSQLNFMSDRRQEQLMKAASDCLALMNASVQPDDALRKVAEDCGANDNEVMLISHAVNNASQLTHIQTADGDKKDGAFPLTDAQRVISSRESTEEKPRSNETDKEQPDAVEIGEEAKTAAQHSLVIDQDLRKVAHASVDLRAEWGLKEIPGYATTTEETVFEKIAAIKTQIDAITADSSSLRDRADAIFYEIGQELRKTAAPRFAVVEEAALAAGVDSEIIDYLYKHANLEALREKRFVGKVKTAGIITTSHEVVKLAEALLSAQDMIETAGQKELEKTAMEGRLAAFFRVKTADEKKKDGGGDSAFSYKLDDVGSGVSSVDSSIGDFLGAKGTENATGFNSAISTLMGGKPADESSGDTKVTLDPQLQQSTINMSARDMIERLMGDDYIKGYSPSEVVDSYNRALSVNPNFGEAELKAYIRQDLATQGAMPLDLMIRASKSHQSGGIES